MILSSDNKILDELAASSCWNRTCRQWEKDLDESGYALYRMDKEHTIRAYRLAYRIMRGDIPKYYHLHHLCRNRACINPVHMVAVHPKIHELIHTDKGSPLFNELLNELPDSLYNIALQLNERKV